MTSTSVMNMVVAQTFPAPIRAVAVSTTYALALAIFGGTAQVIATSLIAWTGDSRSIAWAFGLASLLSIAAFVLIQRRPQREVQPRDC